MKINLTIAGVVFVLLSGKNGIGQTQNPDILIGKWWGEVKHGGEVGELGLNFEKRDDGRVLAREWLPNINAYGSAIGFLNSKDGKLRIPESGIELSRRDKVVVGGYAGQDLTFALQRTDRQLPNEPDPPSVPSGPEPLWTYQGGGKFWASPIVDRQTIYVGDAKGTFHAVDARNGQVKWTFDAQSPLAGTAAIDAGTVYFASEDGHLFKLNAETGKEIWRVDIGTGRNREPFDFFTAAPVVRDQSVYVGSVDGSFRALDATNGHSIWSFKTKDRLRGAALVTNDRVYFGGFDHFVYAVDRKTGKEIWRFDTGSAVTTKPILANGKIVIGTRDRALLYALEEKTGKPLWNVYYWLSWVDSEPVLKDNLLYIGSSDSRRVRAIDPATGKVIWATQVWGWTWGMPLVVGDMVYFATAGIDKYFITQRGSLGALDRKSGVLKWRKPISLKSPNEICGYANSLAYADGKIIAAGLDGTIVAISAK
jgi:outer membrane protein assembly factor BamB